MPDEGLSEADLARLNHQQFIDGVQWEMRCYTNYGDMVEATLMPIDNSDYDHVLMEHTPNCPLQHLFVVVDKVR